MRYWESRRILYTLVLTALAAAWVLATWPHFRPAFTLPNGLRVLILGALANVCYCAAYLVEFAVQESSAWESWRRRRWTLWLAGTLFALLFATYWIGDEIYPFV